MSNSKIKKGVREAGEVSYEDLERRDREAAAAVVRRTREGSVCAASGSATNNMAWGVMPDPQGLTADPQQRWGLTLDPQGFTPDPQ
jgi:hypothetical protein